MKNIEKESLKEKNVHSTIESRYSNKKRFPIRKIMHSMSQLKKFTIFSKKKKKIYSFKTYCSTRSEEILSRLVKNSWKITPRDTASLWKKHQAKKKQRESTLSAQHSGKYECATFAQVGHRSLNLSSARLPKQSKPQSVHASRQIFSGPLSSTSRAQPSLGCAAFVPFLPAARGNFVAPVRSSTKARRLFAKHVYATDRRNHELACIHVNVASPNLQAFLRRDSFPTES